MPAAGIHRRRRHRANGCEVFTLGYFTLVLWFYGNPVSSQPLSGPVAFIGDVHGWDDRLERVLDAIDGTPVFLGDLIDRGPSAHLVLDRVRALVEGGFARCVLGNHEFALVRGLGVPECGIAPFPELYQAWLRGYGGRAVCAALDVRSGDPEALRRRLGECLPWLAGLPWVCQGASADREWIAVHAGLGPEPWQAQVDELMTPTAWWQFGPPQLPPALYSKARAQQLPLDLPAHTCVVSGHTPVPQAVVTRSRILCDTSGGLPGRHLSAVCWPSGRVVTG